MNTFGEGNKPPVLVNQVVTTRPLVAITAAAAEMEKGGVTEICNDSFVGTNVFVLVDTSKYM